VTLMTQAGHSPVIAWATNESEPNTLDFVLPPELEAPAPPEARGLARDEVKLMVSAPSRSALSERFPGISRRGELHTPTVAANGSEHRRQPTTPPQSLASGSDAPEIAHAQFRDLPEFLKAGDLLVINTSRTLSAAIEATGPTGKPLELHLSTSLPAGIWTVEMREPHTGGTRPFSKMKPGDRLTLKGGGAAVIHAPYSCGCDGRSVGDVGRLWLATFDIPGTVAGYFDRFGFPIRYGYVREPWPIEYYQTVYATDVGSAEMPSAGRAFTPELLTRLVAKGIQVAPILLHTGVASLESSEPPYEEYYRIPTSTARQINSARVAGGRVIAVGTTVVRALETVASSTGEVHPGEGWTCHVVDAEHPIRSVIGLLTGLHEPRSSHLMLLAGLVPREHLRSTYSAAIEQKYAWHEFGDLHLILK
jgi:S-adenosylmethionine:tRNA ribosyltransferase-isomerase